MGLIFCIGPIHFWWPSCATHPTPKTLLTRSNHPPWIPFQATQFQNGTTSFCQTLLLNKRLELITQSFNSAPISLFSFRWPEIASPPTTFPPQLATLLPSTVIRLRWSELTKSPQTTLNLLGTMVSWAYFEFANRPLEFIKVKDLVIWLSSGRLGLIWSLKGQGFKTQVWPDPDPHFGRWIK